MQQPQDAAPSSAVKAAGSRSAKAIMALSSHAVRWAL
jgi:hypothetical protein